jgi:Lon protease-like protein
MQDSQNALIEIALFPIPGCVCFPMSVMPLHVFEPRYRNLVKDSVRLKRPIGVCHTKKEIHSAKLGQTPAQILNSNQATYEPEKIFSAGLAEIMDITEDGRLVIEIDMAARYEYVEEIQTLPYRIVKARLYLDLKDETQAASADLAKLRLQTLGDLQKFFGDQQAEEEKVFAAEHWAKMSDEEFSFKLLSIVRFEPHLAQELLQLQSPLARIEKVNQTLRATGKSF